MIRSACSVVLGGLVLTVAACGSGKGRSSFDQDQNDTVGTGTTDGTNVNGSSSGFASSGGTPGLVLDPKNATVIIDTATNPATPGTQIYKVVSNGADITAGATWSLKDSSLGTITDATFTSVPSLPTGVLGKSTQVVAQSSAGQALGTLTVVQLRKTGDSRDFFFIEPYEGTPSPTSDVLKFSTNLKKVDVAFVVDTTGSMSGEIGNLKTALAGSLLAQLQAAIPDVGLAIVDHKDFGQGDPWGVNVRQTVTTTLLLAQNAVNAMSATGGGDEPEAQVGGMYFALTGAANNGAPAIAAHTPAPGTFGGVDFRSGTVPVVVEISDASWHDPSGNASIAALKTAFTAAHAKFVNVADTDYSVSEAQANDLSDATTSNVPAAAFGTISGCAAGQCCTGVSGAGRAASGPAGSCRLNFLSSNGTGVSTGIVNAISAIASGSSYDIHAVASNDPTNPGGVDATKFIKALRAMDEGDATNGCPAAAAKDSDGDGIKDTFIELKVGTPVCFEVIPAVNTTVPPTNDPAFFNAFIDVIGVQGNVELDRRSVLFLVPPQDPGVK